MAYAELSMTPVVDAAGVAEARIRVGDGINTWTVTQVSCEMETAPAGSTGYMRKNGRLVSLFIPTGDAIAGEPPVVLRPSDEITVTWESCTPGDVGQVLVFYDDGRP